MLMRAWFSPPRRLLALFFVVTLAPAAGLVWLGWKLLDQDRDLETQRIMERRESAADRIVDVFQQQISAARRALDDPARTLEAAEADAVVVVFGPSGLTIHPASRVLYLPVVPSEPEAPDRLFLGAERFEFRDRNNARAIEVLGKLVRADDPAVRAGAYLRLARNYRKARDEDRALAAYKELSHISDVRIEGVPVELAALSARCSVLSVLGRSEDLRKEAQSLSDNLSAGRWRITRPVFELHASQVRRWLGKPDGVRTDHLALSEAVDWLWERRRIAGTSGSSLPESMVHSAGERAFTILASLAENRFSYLVAGPEFARRRWLAAVAPVLEAQGVEVILRDDAGEILLGTSPPRLDRSSLRLPADTDLPWTVIVSSREAPLDTARFISRRRLLVSALGLVLLLVLASSYYVARAVSRELAAARLKSDFVSAVSHEFRTPLATLRQLTENLADGRVGADERRLAYYDAQLRATWRLSRLVERLLDFGRMEAGAMRFRPEPVELGGLVRSVVDEFEGVSATSGHRVDLTVEAGLPPVSVDREAMAQAVWNLLDNAIKYSPGRPAVWIEVGREDGPVAIRVRDEGPGLPPEDRKGLFRKFERGSAARATGVKGTGIGLAMVDYIVRNHGGRIRVDSAPGRGSTFTILLETEGP